MRRQLTKSTYITDRPNKLMAMAMEASMKEITKTTTKHYTIQKVAIDMFTYDQSFRDIRSKHKYQCSECFSCGHHFKDGEKISLTIVSGTTNKVLCHSCAQ